MNDIKETMCKDCFSKLQELQVIEKNGEISYCTFDLDCGRGKYELAHEVHNLSYEFSIKDRHGVDEALELCVRKIDPQPVSDDECQTYTKAWVARHFKDVTMNVRISIENMKIEVLSWKIPEEGIDCVLHDAPDEDRRNLQNKYCKELARLLDDLLKDIDYRNCGDSFANEILLDGR